jgi:hypothetical protein
MEILRFDNAFQYSIEIDEAFCLKTVNIRQAVAALRRNAIWHGLLHKDTGEGKLWIRFRESADQR